MNNFKYNLIITRKRNRYTQKEMADMLGVTEGCYAHWEQGRNEPSIFYILQLCKLLHISADDLLGVEPQPAVGEGNAQ